ncbi:MAG: translation initiation factor IF-3 [Candidatus Riflebacteria bacterium]|nr:translation initiation factor IF-3 [Candidatus Riflebacteria bacterium]
MSIPPKKFRVNRWIRSPKLRVVADDGAPLGILTLEEALKSAEEKGLDLVEVSPKSVPPVAKIMDYGKFKYTMEKRNREARKKQKAFTLKEVKMRPKIGDHDFNFKKNHALEFLRSGHKVKLTCSFFGREMSHQELGRVLIDKMIADLVDIGKVEMPPKMEGRNLSVILGPSPKVLKELHAAQLAAEETHGRHAAGDETIPGPADDSAEEAAEIDADPEESEEKTEEAASVQPSTGE